MILPLAAIVVYLLAAGFFAGSETGCYSVNTLRLRLRARTGRRDAAVLQSLLGRMDESIMTTLVGTNIALYAATAIATELWSACRHAELWATLSMTPVIFVFSEMVPKELFRRRADSLMYRLSGFLDAFRVVCKPVTVALRSLLALLTRRLPSEERGEALSRSSLSYVIAKSRRGDVVSAYKATLSDRATRLMAKKVAEAVIPLQDAVMISGDLRGEDLRAAVAESGRFLLPVFGGSRSEIIGVLDTLDCVCPGRESALASELAQPVPRIHEGEPATSALVALRHQNRHMAVVVDAGGRAVGFVTERDLVDDFVKEMRRHQ